MRISRHINASFRRLYQCQSNIFSTFLSKITKYNRVPLGFDPSVARLVGHDPTPQTNIYAGLRFRMLCMPHVCRCTRPMRMIMPSFVPYREVTVILDSMNQIMIVISCVMHHISNLSLPWSVTCISYEVRKQGLYSDKIQFRYPTRKECVLVSWHREITRIYGIISGKSACINIILRKPIQIRSMRRNVTRESLHNNAVCGITILNK